MTPEQYSEYVRVSGERIRTRLTGMIPMLKVLDAERAQKAITRITDEERARAKSVVRRMPVQP